jgi:hypothetical protein
LKGRVEGKVEGKVEGTDEITTICCGTLRRSDGDYFVCPFNPED